MIYAQKGNQICRIEEHQIATLVEQGYNIVDESGAVLQQAVPTDIALLKKCYIEHVQKIKELEKEIESLKSSSKKTAVKEKVVEEDVKVEEPAEPKIEEVAETKTKSKRTAKK